MKSKTNPYLWVAAGSLLASTITVTSAADYQYGGQLPFSITASDQARHYAGQTTFIADPTGGVYDRDASAVVQSDITYSHFDLSSLEGKTIVGDVSFNDSVNASWGGAINDGLIATANAAWTAAAGSATPGFTEIPDSPRITNNYNTYDTAAWTITNATFSSILADLANFHGFAVTAGDASTAHFAALPTITGTVEDQAIDVRLVKSGVSEIVDLSFPELDGQFIRDQLTAAGILHELLSQRGPGIERAEHITAGAVEKPGDAAEDFSLGAFS